MGAPAAPATASARAGSVGLYRPFFHFVRRRLAVGGYAVLDAPGTGFYTNPDEDGNLRLMHGGDWDIYYNTIRSAGFESILPFHTRLDSENASAFALLETWDQTPTFENMFTNVGV